MSGFDEQVQRLLDKSQITDQLYRWARGVARKDWDLVRSVFHSDARDDHGTFDGGVEDFIGWQKRHHVGVDQSVHFMGNILIEFAASDLALVETYVVAYHNYTDQSPNARSDILGDGAKGLGAVNSRIVGRYLDRFERRDGMWRIAYRMTVYETLRADQLGGRGLQPQWIAARRDEGDPLLKMRRDMGLA
jgi:hypothetical protein